MSGSLTDPYDPPVTPQPNRLQDLGAFMETMSTQIFGIMYITLTGLMGSMVPTSHPWSLPGCSLSYIIKLAPILWWVLPTRPAVLVPTSATALTHTWLSDTEAPVNHQSQNTNTSPTIVAPKEEPLKLPNEGRDGAYVSFMRLKSSQATNQEPTQERGTGMRPGPMTMMLKQDNQVAKSRFLTNERTPRPSIILLLSDPSTQFPQPSFPQCPDEPMENVKFGGGVLYRPKDPALQTYHHF
ncbi:hypothetical protein DSO57_1015101 [Entomophthora muscae]|uniref:Uncharacterized protein n=1 Tax=Entomophthora muscae TaxID=34485 RepID=A0ACC2U3B0_9FUNG|nr:hypothetical protein DSO57_1015101 [Entomophthora muscae]